jgi:hypothetical protein
MATVQDALTTIDTMATVQDALTTIVRTRVARARMNG